MDAALTTVFRQIDGSNVRLVLGDASNPSSPEDLMGGKYVLDLRIPSMFVTEEGRELDYNDITGFAYDYYLDYASRVVEDEAESCSVYVRKTAENALYMTFSIKLADGPFFEGSWYGDVTDVTEFPDLTPVEPVGYKVEITDENGAVLKSILLERLELRRENDYKVRGGDPQYGGATFDAYVFYFCSADTENVDDILFTPHLMIPVDAVTGEEIELATAGISFEFRYQNENLYKTSYSENYTMYGMTTWACPDDAKVTVSQDADAKVWKVSFSMTDYISGAYTHGKNTHLTINWEGPATRYNGRETNDMDASEY